MSEAAQSVADQVLEIAAPAHRGSTLLGADLDVLRKNAVVRALAPNECLFAEGEWRSHVYLIEEGAVWLYAQRPAQSPAPLEIAFQGDLIGMGYLRSHTSTARAIAFARVACIPREAFFEIAGWEPAVKAKQDQAIEMEFTSRRMALTSSKRSALHRVAAFLVAVSRNNQHEGRDPTRISEALSCGLVGEFLSLDVATLGRILVELQTLGLVERASGSGLRLRDVSALERLCEMTPRNNARSDGDE